METENKLHSLFICFLTVLLFGQEIIIIYLSMLLYHFIQVLGEKRNNAFFSNS